ncbi:endo-1,3-beta-glucanase [Hortaea werneckii]|nr:endo-1,3-beta-glucanase [Hortaea werneckii]
MKHPQQGFRATCLLSLIASLQVPSSYAIPLAIERAVEPPSLSDVDSETSTPIAAQPTSANAVIQIADGQVQNPVEGRSVAVETLATVVTEQVRWAPTNKPAWPHPQVDHRWPRPASIPSRSGHHSGPDDKATSVDAGSETQPLTDATTTIFTTVTSSMESFTSSASIEESLTSPSASSPGGFETQPLSDTTTTLFTTITPSAIDVTSIVSVEASSDTTTTLTTYTTITPGFTSGASVETSFVSPSASSLGRPETQISTDTTTTSDPATPGFTSSESVETSSTSSSASSLGEPETQTSTDTTSTIVPSSSGFASSSSIETGFISSSASSLGDPETRTSTDTTTTNPGASGSTSSVSVETSSTSSSSSSSNPETTRSVDSSETSVPTGGSEISSPTTTSVSETTYSSASASSPAAVASQTVTSTQTLGSTTEVILSTTVTSIPLTSLTTSEVQSASSPVSADTSGSINTALNTTGHTNSAPFPTSVASASGTLTLISSESLSSAGPTATSGVTTLQATDIFVPIATGAPPANINRRDDGIIDGVGIRPLGDLSVTGPLQTNKFYAGFFLGTQTTPTFTHPYSISWPRGEQPNGQSYPLWGLAISHVEASQRVFGARNPSKDAGDSSYFANPLGIRSLMLSALELNGGAALTTDSQTQFSVNVNLGPAETPDDPLVTCPILQGMGFLTCTYNSATPILQSDLGFTDVTYNGSVIADRTTYSYILDMGDNTVWMLYVTTQTETYSAASFTLANGTVVGPQDFQGYIQVAKLPSDNPDARAVYSRSAGAYATSARISGSVQGTSGSYTLEWQKQGDQSKPLLMFGLPHHLETLASGETTDVVLATTTKGYATGILADSWTLTESELAVDIGFAPWRPNGDSGTGESVTSLSSSTQSMLREIAMSELSQNFSEQANQGSLYFDGKALAKFATICYAANDLADDMALSQSGLVKLKEFFALHVDNQMEWPLVYDELWGGVVSSQAYSTGDANADFGNAIYNDHHFHFGYFVYTAAVIAYLDPEWKNDQQNVDWVNMLVRDYANSIPDDPYFPMQRNFDWYHGHSWAHGLTQVDDGKDQESSSEDTMASYAIKMWGQVLGDENMEARGNLMLAVQRRSLNDYYLYADDNSVQPARYTGNRAAGILFENKVDHTTYFGALPEYIQGIHMLPLLPHTPYIRQQTFVQQEWDDYFGDSGLKPATSISGGWRGIVEGNRATIDPVFAYDFFSNASGDFRAEYLDGGASQTWYLAYAAALGGDAGASTKARRDGLTLDGRSALPSDVGGVKESVENFFGRRSRFGSSRSSRLRQRTSG